MANECVDPDDEERTHYRRIVAAFRCYMPMFESRLVRAEENVNGLSPRHQQLLRDYKRHLQSVRTCIEKNSIVLLAIAQDAFSLFGNEDEFVSGGQFDPPNWQDVEKLQATLKSIFRDWSPEGAAEREQCYKPILDAIEKRFGDVKQNRDKIHILVPGAGLGRLMFEIACRGFTCQGNEVSYYMLLSSYFLLNRCHSPNMLTIYPWVHNFANNLTCASQTRGVTFPDAVASEVLKNTSLMSMAAGDFMEVYKQANSWDCVATCFFIDCSSNIVECIERIYKILKPGGMWVNLGPLLYHYTDSTIKQPLIEPPFEIVLNIIKTVGFKVQKLVHGVKSEYAHNSESMLQYRYYSVFLICVKPLPTEQRGPHAEMQIHSTHNLGGPSFQEGVNPGHTNTHCSTNSQCKKKRPGLGNSLDDSSSSSGNVSDNSQQAPCSSKD